MSYGKEVPLCTEAAESCWALNRRADVSPGAKAKDLTRLIAADEHRERAAATPGSAQPDAAARRPAQVRRAGPQKAPATVESPATPSK